MPPDVVRFDPGPDGMVVVSWDSMSGTPPVGQNALLAARLEHFAFVHCCGGIMHRTELTNQDGYRTKDVIWCRQCGIQITSEPLPTLRTLVDWLRAQQWSWSTGYLLATPAPRS